MSARCFRSGESTKAVNPTLHLDKLFSSGWDFLRIQEIENTQGSCLLVVGVKLAACEVYFVKMFPSSRFWFIVFV